MFKKTIIRIFLVALLIMTISLPTMAAPTETYTRIDVPSSTETVISREMYVASDRITASTLCLSQSLEGITDIHTDVTGKIFLLCGDESRLIQIENGYYSAKEIYINDENGKLDFKGARGIFSDGEQIFIADTSNSRVLISDFNGNLKKVISSPKSDLIPDDFLFQPLSVGKDSEGYVYILSLGCYYGALMYSPEYEFMGFYGANTVQTSALDTLSYLWKKLTSTDAKKASSLKTLPYSFSDFFFDQQGFMVTVTGAISSDKYSGKGTVGQIKRISNNGDNILFKRKLNGDTVSSSSTNFLEAKKPEGAEVQDLVSVTVNSDNYIFVLDGGNGTVYIYDPECNFMSAFGGGYGTGNQVGVFKNAKAIALDGDNLLVADKDDCDITVYELTDYGRSFMEAQSLYLQGNYDEAKELWSKVLSMNRNCQLAYRGLAMAYYNESNYCEALKNAKLAMDYSVYDMAWQEIVSEYIANHFIWIILIIVFIIALIILGTVYIKKHNLKIIKNQEFKLMCNVPLHPFNSFEDLKYKKMGSVKLGIGITVLFYTAGVLNVIACGFLYTTTLIRNYNSIFTLGSTAGLIILWSLCNWLVCSMFEGKGTFKEVYVSTCYSLVPWIVFQFIKIVLTHFFPLSASGLISGIETALLIFTFFLITVAMIKIHEYDFFKFIWTGLITLFLMILVVFIIFLCGILVMQFITFIISIYEEIAYR